MKTYDAGVIIMLIVMLAATFWPREGKSDQWHTGLTPSGQMINLYSDDSGYTTGTVGNSMVNIYTDSSLTSTGTIGGQMINLISDDSGYTTGTVGGQFVSCDAYGNCY